VTDRIAEVGRGAWPVALDTADKQSHYEALLNAKRIAIEGSIRAAEAQFGVDDAVFAAEADIPRRRNLVIAKIGAPVGLGDADAEAHYFALLIAKRAALEVSIRAAEAQFGVDDAIFAAELDIPRRRDLVDAKVRGPRVGLIDAEADAHYLALLTEKQTRLNASIRAADVQFGLDDGVFGLEADIPRRRDLVAARIGAPIGLGDADAEAHYLALLTAKRAALDVSINAAQMRYTAAERVFNGEANIATRLGLVDADIAGVAGLGLGAEEAAHYTALLTQERNRLALIFTPDVAARNDFTANFGAIVDEDARLQAMRNALTNIAAFMERVAGERAEYQVLVERERDRLEIVEKQKAPAKQAAQEMPTTSTLLQKSDPTSRGLKRRT